MAKIRIGIVGTGGMASVHAEAFKAIPGVELTSCLDVIPGRADAFAERQHVRYVAKDLDQLLTQVDAVSVVTPDRSHAAPSLAALRAGKHLLCEKPLTTTLVEARALARAARAAKGVVAMVNFTYRRAAALQRAIEVAARGELGAIRHVHGSYLQTWLSAPVWGHWTSDGFLWRLQTAAGSGGVLGDLGCHILDLTTVVAGGVRRARCALATFPKLDAAGKPLTVYRGKRLDANDSAVIELEFDNGALGVVHTTRWATGHVNHLALEVNGTSGALRFDLDRSHEQLELCLGKATNPVAWKTVTLKPAPTIWQRFVAAIRTGAAQQPDVLRGAQVQAYLDACERSARSGRWEKVRSWV
jgi:predicted dehydrogenase